MNIIMSNIYHFQKITSFGPDTVFVKETIESEIKKHLHLITNSKLLNQIYYFSILKIL